MNNSRNERREQVREIHSKNPQLGDNVSVSRSNSGPAPGELRRKRSEATVQVKS
jgi:hypothetical protein